MRLYFLFAFLFLASLWNSQTSYEWFKIGKYKVGTLDLKVKETSSLSFFGDKLYTLNDGGNPAEIYQLDPMSGKIKAFHKLSIPNKDWEALASDSLSLYIGDFGNNGGRRKDLKIYKLNAESFELENEFPFHIPEQTAFNSRAHRHNFDLESLVVMDGRLHLFTKEWVSGRVAHYTVSQETPSLSTPAKLLERFDLGFMATDAEYHEGKLYLVGYTKRMEVYLSVFTQDKSGLFFSSNPKKYYLGLSSSVGQIESIAIRKGIVLLSGEEFQFKFLKSSPALYSFPLEKLK